MGTCCASENSNPIMYQKEMDSSSPKSYRDGKQKSEELAKAEKVESRMPERPNQSSSYKPTGEEVTSVLDVRVLTPGIEPKY